MDPAELIYQKARTFSRWSYWGIAFPVVGWALVAASNSLLNELKATTKEELQDITYVRKLNSWSVFASLWYLWLGVIVMVVTIVGAIIHSNG